MQGLTGHIPEGLRPAATGTQLWESSCGAGLQLIQLSAALPPGFTWSVLRSPHHCSPPLCWLMWKLMLVPAFFLPPKYFPVVLTAGTFQEDGDNSAGCETSPPKPKATSVKTIDKRDRQERRKGKHISEKLCCFWLWPTVCIESSLLSARAVDTCQLSEPCLCSSALCQGKTVSGDRAVPSAGPVSCLSALPCSQDPWPISSSMLQLAAHEHLPSLLPFFTSTLLS